MKLPIIKQPEYLSPSSLSMFAGCQYKFYMMRMSGIDFQRKPQTDAMGLGTLFDIFVKIRLAEFLGINRPALQLDNLIKNVEPQNYKYMEHAKRLVVMYEEAGRIRELLKEGIDGLELEEKKTMWSVPILGKPDAKAKGMPIDWKVSGFFAQIQPSPKKGYLQLIDLETGKDRGAHPKAGLNMEEIDESWAAQLVTYAWLLNKPIIAPFIGAIETIIFTGDKPRCAVYRAIIGEDFQRKLVTQFQETWDKIQKGEIEEPIPNKWKCEAFGEVCDVGATGRCSAYSAILGDPVEREVYLA